nr:MAG: ribonuclease R [Acidobacteriota bacterium]
MQVLEPASRIVIGVLERRGRSAQVRPYDSRVARNIRVVSRGLGDAEDGMAVGVEVLEPPDRGGVAAGRVVEVLGFPDRPGMDIQLIVRKYDLRHHWPEEVLGEANAIDDPPEKGEIAAREDFRALPTVTIDGETAKDFDDAVSVQALPGDGIRLYVHIADVAHYVREHGAMDREALARGASVYFPGHVLPMLPERLSNDLCSLRPQEDRLSQSVVLDVDASGRVFKVRFADGVIRSAERMTYTQVAGIIEGDSPELLHRYDTLVEMFRLMEKLFQRLWARRRQRGSIDFDLPVPEIVLNARGEMTGVFPSQRNIAHRIIEEFMLAANEAVAEYLFERRTPTLYRIHESPDPLRLEILDEALSGLGYRLPRPLDAVRPQHFQKLLDRAAGKSEERFVTQMVLRAMRQARYDPDNVGHFGLAARHYLHFTSPIRRYPDLVVHRILRALRGGDLAPGSTQEERWRRELPEVARQTSRRERTAEEAERELEQWKKLAFMGEKLGEEYHGFVSGVMNFGLFVQLEEYFVEGLIHISTLGDDFYEFDERRHLLRGRASGQVFRLGDRLEVRVVRVDHFLKQMDLELKRSSPDRTSAARRRRGRRKRTG